MEDQRQTLNRINQESLRKYTWVHELNLTDGIFPTRDNYPIHWGSKSRKIMGSHRILGSLLLLLLHPHHEGNIRRENHLVKGGI